MGLVIRMKFIAFTIFFSILVMLSTGSQCVEAGVSFESLPSRRDIPIIDPGTKEEIFKVNFNEQQYTENAFDIIRNNLPNDINTVMQSNAVDVAVMYLNYVLNNKLENITDFYHEIIDTLNPQKLAEYAHSRLASFDKVQLIKSWYYGNFQIFLFEYTSPTKSDSTMISIVKIDNKFFRIDHWKAAEFVEFLFAYMGSQDEEIQSRKIIAKEYPYSINIKGLDVDGNIIEENPATISFDGTLYDFKEDWTVVGNQTYADEQLNFIHKVFYDARNGGDEEFLNLCVGKKKERFLDLQISNPRLFKGFKLGYAQSHVKDLLTMNLGHHYIHYYISRSNPSRIQWLFFEKVNGKYGLSRGLSRGNLNEFLKAEAVKKGMYELWAAQKK